MAVIEKVDDLRHESRRMGECSLDHATGHNRSVQAITAAPFAAGLSNQKMALASLILAARAERTAVALPALLDFEPGSVNHPRRTYGEIFDLAELEAVAQVAFVRCAEENRDPASLFHALASEIGVSQDGGTLGTHPVLALLAAMRPERTLQARVYEARRRFHEMGGRVVCQMRVERDWVTYLDSRLAARLGATQDLTTDPIAIAQKLIVTFGRDIGPVLVTCDLKGMTITSELLAESVAQATGLRLLFKHELIDGDPPSAPLAASLFDFELMATAEQMVGTTLSSFFGLASLTCLARRRATTAWAYNAFGPALLRRTDNGAFANLQRATAGGCSIGNGSTARPSR